MAGRKTERNSRQADELQAWLRHAAGKGLRWEALQRRTLETAGAEKARANRRKRIGRLAKALSEEIAADDRLQLSVSLDVASLAEERGIALPFSRPRSHADGFQQTATTLERLLPVLELVGDAADRGFFEGNRGRPSNVGTNEFAKCVADFHEDALGRKFTVYYHQGTVTTRGFEFSVTLLHRFSA